MDHPELRNLTFGEVFAEPLETRGLDVTPLRVAELVENAGLGSWAFIDRMASADSHRLMSLDLHLAEKLNFS